MRDERGRERISIQLEPRQITMFIVVCLVTLGGLFAGGYVLGRQHAQDTVAMGPALSGLAAIDAEAPGSAAPESAEARAAATALGEVEFMFPSALGSRPGRKVKRPSPIRLAEAHVGVQGAAPEKPAAKVERPEPKVKVKAAKAKPKARRERVAESRPKRDAELAAGIHGPTRRCRTPRDCGSRTARRSGACPAGPGRRRARSPTGNGCTSPNADPKLAAVHGATQVGPRAGSGRDLCRDDSPQGLCATRGAGADRQGHVVSSSRG